MANENSKAKVAMLPTEKESTLHPIKERMYSREEVIALLNKLSHKKETGKWIEGSL